MRGAAKVLKARPREVSKASSAFISPTLPGADQLVEVGLHGEAAGELPGDVVHEAQMLVEQVLPGDSGRPWR